MDASNTDTLWRWLSSFSGYCKTITSIVVLVSEENSSFDDTHRTASRAARTILEVLQAHPSTPAWYYGRGTKTAIQSLLSTSSLQRHAITPTLFDGAEADRRHLYNSKPPQIHRIPNGAGEQKQLQQEEENPKGNAGRSIRANEAIIAKNRV